MWKQRKHNQGIAPVLLAHFMGKKFGCAVKKRTVEALKHVSYFGVILRLCCIYCQGILKKYRTSKALLTKPKQIVVVEKNFLHKNFTTKRVRSAPILSFSNGLTRLAFVHAFFTGAALRLVGKVSLTHICARFLLLLARVGLRAAWRRRWTTRRRRATGRRWWTANILRW